MQRAMIKYKGTFKHAAVSKLLKEIYFVYAYITETNIAIVE